MKTYKYWAKFEGNLTIDGTSVNAVFLGGSDISPEEAGKAAMCKHDLVQQKINGVKHEFDDYEVEIREEQIKVISDAAVITRNRYGAHVMNVEKLMILDVDEPPRSILDIFSKKTPDWKLVRIIDSMEKLHKELNLPVLGLRLYKTYKGFRVIVTGKDIAPNEKLAQVISRKLNTDDLYWTLCKKQHCYRARLTPKPYRIEYQPIKIRLPDSLERRDEIMSWENGYLAAAKDYSVCRYIKTIGDNNMDSLTSFHDEYTGAYADRKLA